MKKQLNCSKGSLKNYKRWGVGGMGGVSLFHDKPPSFLCYFLFWSLHRGWCGGLNFYFTVTFFLYKHNLYKHTLAEIP